MNSFVKIIGIHWGLHDVTCSVILHLGKDKQEGTKIELFRFA